MKLKNNKYYVENTEQLLELIHEMMVWQSAMQDNQIAKVQISKKLLERMNTAKFHEWFKQRGVELEEI